MTVPFSQIGLILVILCSVGLGLYTYRLILLAVNNKQQRDDDLDDQTARLLDRYKKKLEDEQQLADLTWQPFSQMKTKN